MKRLLLILSCCALMLSLAACGEKPADDKLPENTQGTVDSQPEELPGEDKPLDADDAPGGENPEEENPEEEDPAEEGITDSLEILNNVWNEYAEDERFPACGGTEFNPNFPGAYNLDETEADALDSMIAFPAEYFDSVGDAASLIHMLNTNNFTCGVVKLTDFENLETVTAAIKENIKNRMWVCGAPQIFFIAHIDDFVITAYGHEEILNTFRDKFASVYPDAVFDYEDTVF